MIYYQNDDLGRERLRRLQVEVVIQVQVVQVLPVDEQVQHVIALSAHLQPDLHPIELRLLEELRCFEGFKQTLFVEGLGGAVVQLVEHPHFE